MAGILCLMFCFIICDIFYFKFAFLCLLELEAKIIFPYQLFCSEKGMNNVATTCDVKEYI